MQAPTKQIYVKLMVTGCSVCALGHFTEEEEKKMIE